MDLNGSKCPAVVMAIVTPQPWLQVFSKLGERRWGGGREAAPAEAQGFSAFHSALFLVEERWPRTDQASSLGLWHWQELVATLSLPSAACSMP